jgi:uncharacterized peroxidase-related enzyme
MARISLIEPAEAHGKAKELLDKVQQQFGMVPNVFKVFAHSPAALEGHFSMSRSLAAGRMDRHLREKISVAAAGLNRCTYCASAHTTIGKRAGIPEEELELNLKGKSNDPKTQAALDFVNAILSKRGRLSDADLENMRTAGFGDEEIVEIIFHTGMTALANYVNNIAQTDIDFPLVQIEDDPPPR